MKRSATGFTLVEMLLVVAIISLLIAILLPTLNRTQENSRRTRCATNLRFLITGMTSYALDDVKRHFMPTNHYTNDDISHIVPKYTGGRDAAICPSTKHTALDLSASFGSPAFSNRHSYEIFSWIGAGTYPSGEKYSQHTLITPKSPRPHLLWIPMDDSTEHGNNNWPDPGNNHGAEGLNLGYVDGHAGFHNRAEYVRSAIDSFHPWFGGNSTCLSLAQSAVSGVGNVGGWHGVWTYQD